MQNCIEVNLRISAREYLLLYKGVARNVMATSVDGRRVRFPAKILQRFVTREGINGCFLIYFTHDGKFSHIEKNQRICLLGRNGTGAIIGLGDRHHRPQPARIDGGIVVEGGGV